jgi:hypothetical protein
VQKDAKLAFGKVSTVFISYLSAFAVEIAKNNGQKTVNSNHIEAALEKIGFGEWREEIHSRQQKYQSSASHKRKEAGVEETEMSSTIENLDASREVHDVDLAEVSDDGIEDTQPMDTD